MTWQPIWITVFGEAPRPADIAAMDEFARLCHPHLDDPLFIIAMFFQRQVALLSTSAGDVVQCADQLDAAAASMQGRSDALSDAGRGLVSAAHAIRAQVQETAETVAALSADLVRNRRAAAGATRTLETAQRQLSTESKLWRLDLPLLVTICGVLAMTAIVVMVTLLRSPPIISPEDAAAVLAPSKAGQPLTAHANGDLKMLLTCDHPTWTYRAGYCRPKPGAREIQGWNAFQAPVEKSSEPGPR